MMKRPWRIWVPFVLGVAVVLAAMAWVTSETLELDAARLEARAEAVLEENVRLALWRMESTLAPLIATESGRPAFVYSALYEASQAYGRVYTSRPGVQWHDVKVVSPLVSMDSPLIHLHFQVEPDGEVTSPQVPPPPGPAGDMTPDQSLLLVGVFGRSEAKEKLAELAPRIRRDELIATLPRDPPMPRGNGRQAPEDLNQLTLGEQQMARNEGEYTARARRFQQSANFSNTDTLPGQWGGTRIRPGMTVPLWVDGELLLARRARGGAGEVVQGAWLNWPAVREWLLDEAQVPDLLPGAELVPATDGGEGGASRRLASLPVQLVPGPPPPLPDPGWTPLRMSLVVAWVCVLVAIGATGGLLVGALSLAERRAAFVSAVTHEMRTPLTTFQLYTDMLAQGMVEDEQKRQRYLGTLRTEAERLGHLVENVLSYARLQRGRAERRAESVNVGDLVEGAADRLRGRAEQADMELVVDVPEDVADRVVRADRGSVEQVLFNLVDNACKYAAAADDRRIHLEGDPAAGGAALAVRDHGPGVSQDVRGRLFKPFAKSARAAAGSAPGVGLGLALSRRLARRMGGDLRWEADGTDGARFVLRLPGA